MAPTVLAPLVRAALGTWAGTEDLEGVHSAAYISQALPRCHRSVASSFDAAPDDEQVKASTLDTDADKAENSDQYAEKIEKSDQEGLPAAAPGMSLDDFLANKYAVHREYKVLVDTGQLPQSTTHGDVFIQLVGNRGKTGLIKLKKGFNAKSRLEFSLFALDVGRIEKIHLVQNSSDRWFCDRVWLSAPEGNREFPVGQFIGFPNNPEVVVGPALASFGAAAVPLALALEACRSLHMHSIAPCRLTALSSEASCVGQASHNMRKSCAREFL